VSVALVIQHAKHMRRLILPSVACPALPHSFPHCLIRGTIFGGKLLNLKCGFYFLCSFCLKHFSI